MVDRVLMAYVLMGICVMGLLWFIKQRTQRNRAEVAEANKPAVAGDDELGGAAKDPGQFEEPDDDALDEMEDILRTAAEAQGLEYEGDQPTHSDTTVSTLIQDSVHQGDIVGGDKFHTKVVNDPEAIARAAIKGYEMGKGSDGDESD